MRRDASFSVPAMPAEQVKHPRLIEAEVTGLLGRFTHRIEFPSDWPFVILHGPNGVGKTKLLEIISAVCNGRLSRLLRVPFRTAELRFDDRSRVMITRIGQLTLPGVTPPEETSTPELDVRYWIAGEPGDPFTITAANSDWTRISRLLERDTPLHRMGPEDWWDPHFNDTISTDLAVERYWDSLPPSLAESQPSSPSEFRALVERLPIHLIETQRLLVSEHLRARDGRAQRTLNTVERYSEDLVNRLHQALAENSTTAQTLDRTFPRRVMNASDPRVTDQQIRERYAEQSRLRDRLQEVSLLNAATAELPLPDRDLKEWERPFLWTYLDDAQNKLATFEPLLDRISLLQEIVNSRFLFKTLVVDRERGFRFETETGERLGPKALSSGEQHELVLAYDLLFNVRPGSLVLIDEPEISLHVSWQQQFLRDLMRISELQSLRFVVATHSPQIIHKWWSYAVALFDDAPATPSPGELA